MCKDAAKIGSSDNRRCDATQVPTRLRVRTGTFILERRNVDLAGVKEESLLPVESKILLVAVLTGGTLAACANEPRRAGAPAALQQIAPAMQDSTETQIVGEGEEARIRPITGPLPPRHPPEVEGLSRVGTGTGFFITPDRVLTNFHVVNGCKALTVGNNVESAEAGATLIAGDRMIDLALLSAPAVEAKPAIFQMAVTAQTGERLAIVGYPEHGLPVLKAELLEVGAYGADLMAAGERYVFYGAVRRGNSGGPVLDDTAAVVGVVTAQIDTVAVYRMTGIVIDDVGIAISNRTVLDFLQANRITLESAASDVKLSSQQVLEAARGFVRQIGCWR